jgi:hypothetical protein
MFWNWLTSDEGVRGIPHEPYSIRIFIVKESISAGAPSIFTNNIKGEKKPNLRSCNILF